MMGKRIKINNTNVVSKSGVHQPWSHAPREMIIEKKLVVPYPYRNDHDDLNAAEIKLVNIPSAKNTSSHGTSLHSRGKVPPCSPMFSDVLCRPIVVWHIA